MVTEFPLIATGSIVCLTVPGNRSPDDESRRIPAIVLDQFTDDGTLVLFCFHFEGQFLSRTPARDVEVLFDAGRLAPDAESSVFLNELREIVQNDIATLQRQFVEFQEQVLGMVIGESTAPPPTTTVASYGNAPRNGVSGPPIAPVAAPDITVSEPDFAEAPHSVVSTRRRR